MMGLPQRPAPARASVPAIARGMTLVEVLVVVVIVAALATLLTLRVGGEATDEARVAVTRATLVKVRDAVIAYQTEVGPTLQPLGPTLKPVQVRDLFLNAVGTTVSTYDPASALGWHGPYLSTSTGTYVVDDDPPPPSGFTPLYGATGDPAIVDGWGRPVVIQVPDPDGDDLWTTEDRRHARLVSAGPDGIVQVPLTDADCAAPGTAWYPLRTGADQSDLVPGTCGDDVVLYLRVPDLRPVFVDER